MAQVTLPSPDAAICSSWTEQDRNLYNKLNYYLTKMGLEYMDKWQIWTNLVGKKKWQSNMGPTMRSVSKVPSPVNRQFFVPAPMTGTPKKDIIDVRERSVDDVIYRHKFESPIINFLPSFQDFLKDHVSYAVTDISAKIQLADDFFIRGYMYAFSPNVYLADRLNGNELVSAPYAYPTYSYDATNLQTTLTGDGKTSEWFKAQVPLLGNAGNLSLNTINLAVTILETDLRIPPWEGAQAKEDPKLQNKYVLVCSGEAYNQFIYDPWLLRFKSIDLDVVTKGFQGSLFGRVTCKLEPLPIRMKADGTIPDPELRELNPAAFNAGESVPNPDYVNAPYEIAFLMGYNGAYKSIEVGPPPADFAGGNMPEGYGKMVWNGMPIVTKDILTACKDSNNNIVYDTNKYGEFLQIVSQVTFGCSGEQRRAVIPIIFKRWRGARNTVVQA